MVPFDVTWDIRVSGCVAPQAAIALALATSVRPLASRFTRTGSSGYPILCPVHGFHMSGYTSDQLERIKHAVAQAREAMRHARRYEAIVFAQAFIASGGIQIPGQSVTDPMQERVARSVLASLRDQRHASDDATVRREIKRAYEEARWVSAAQSDRVVGFLLQLGPGAVGFPECRELLGRNHGLGAAVFPKAQIVVLPPECVDYEFTPVLEDEVEQ